MQIEVNNVFAVEIEGEHFHLECVPADKSCRWDDCIMRGDEDPNDLYFCDECSKQIEEKINARKSQK